MFEIFVTGHYSSLVGKFGDSFGGVANVSCHCMHTKTQLAPSVVVPCSYSRSRFFEQENLLSATQEKLQPLFQKFFKQNTQVSGT